MKRVFDIVTSLAVLLTLSPIILLTAVLVRAKLGSPILFKQIRPGKDGKPFQMVQFRSMLDAVDKDGNPLPDEQRLPGFGKHWIGIRLIQWRKNSSVLRSGIVGLDSPRLGAKQKNRRKPVQERTERESCTMGYFTPHSFQSLEGAVSLVSA